jgi:serine/threonine-protein kinase
MTEEKNRGLPPSTEVSPFDLQLSACAIEGHQDDGTQSSERRRGERRRAQASVSSNTVRLAAGQLIGDRYRIERELGEGGMGVVYLAADEQVPGEKFAIKLLKEELRPQALALLREEVRKTRKLSHPNIVDVHSVNVDGQKLYVLMEYLEGKSLDKLLDEEFGRGMPFSHAWPIIEDVGAALRNAHDHNVIHSDLKPANVFLTTSGKTKLLDFGVARVSRGPLLHAPPGSRALTPAYASCEMLKGEEADRRDDIYSFACVIYEMLCGDRPFGVLNALEAREVGTRVPPLAVLSQAQNEALARALGFDRAARTPSVEQLLAGLVTDKAPGGRRNAVLVPAVIATLAVLGFAYLALDKLWISRRSVVVQQVASEAQTANPRAAATPVTFNPPPHSIAVLPFVNMSGDKEQEYFSDGLSEELLDDLTRINELQVAARTSAFSFKGKDTDIGTIARKLNVASVLEGSVRRSGHTIRITAQLNNAVTGFHIWSQTYDRDLGDVLELQAEIATEVAGALKITLLGDAAAKIELGGTRTPAAFDAYLRAVKASWRGDENGVQDAIAAYAEAIRLDPGYAGAFAGRSIAYSNYAVENATGSAIREFFDKAQRDAHQALALAPEFAGGYLALATYYEQGPLDFAQASKAYDRARTLAPGDARVLRDSGWFAVEMGHTEPGLTALHRAVVLDPMNPLSHAALMMGLYYSRQYQEAIAAAAEVITLNSEFQWAYGYRGLADYGLGDLERARATCETKPDDFGRVCLAVTYEKLGRHADAEAQLAKYKARYGDKGAYEYASIYAQWGNVPKALAWLDTAIRVRNSDLEYLKTDPLMDPLRNEPRFRAIERALKFP